MQWIDELIQEDRRVSQQYLADSVGISRERAQHIIQLLGYRKVCARWVPRQLTEPMKERRADVCKSLMRQYRRQKDDFLASIVTGDETWVHHYEPESKRASMEFRRKGSSPPLKFKTFPSAGKLMLTVFCDMQGVILIEFLEPGSTVNSDSYVRTLSSLKARIRRVRPDMKTVHLQHLHTPAARPPPIFCNSVSQSWITLPTARILLHLTTTFSPNSRRICGASATSQTKR